MIGEIFEFKSRIGCLERVGDKSGPLRGFTLLFFLPGGLVRGQFCGQVFALFFYLGEACSKIACFPDGLFGGHGDDRLGMRISATSVNGSLIEECSQRVVVLLAERIIFVVMAATAVEGEAHPHRADGFGHVEDVVDAVFFGDGASFAIDGMIAEKAGGEDLLLGGIGKEITCDLPDGEVVVGDVSINGIDDPVAPRPHGAFAVALKAIGVGVACGIEPGPGETFSEGRVGEEGVDELAPGVR